jgi:hypothetical protein
MFVSLWVIYCAISLVGYLAVLCFYSWAETKEGARRAGQSHDLGDHIARAGAA